MEMKGNIEKEVLDGGSVKLKGFERPLTSFKAIYILNMMQISREHAFALEFS